MKFASLIGGSRLLHLERLAEAYSLSDGVRLFGKLEGDNPSGSVKDRAAWHMVSLAVERGLVSPGDALVEATSGNTGIALAMAAARMGLHMTLVVPHGATVERVRAMRAYGAHVIRTGEDETIEQAREIADRIASRKGALILDQFSNPDNWRAHYETTGPEIWQDTGGEVTHFVSAMGTTGTIMGVSRFLHDQRSDIEVVGVQPTPGSRIPGIRKWSPEMVPRIYEPERVDRILEVDEDDARGMARQLAIIEGVLAGMSSGGALSVAVRVAQELEQGVVVAIICDRGDRYLSSDLFVGVTASARASRA